MVPPGAGINQMELVDQGTSGAARACQFDFGRAQQLAPTLFDHPADLGFGQGAAQHGDRGQGVQHIAHGSQAHHQRARMGSSLGSYAQVQSRLKRS
jgi:hypothetical protein